VRNHEAQLDTWTQEKLDRFVAQAAVETQRHKHTHTCMKNGGAATDRGCRLQMPRPLQPHTELRSDDGVDVLLVKRTAQDLVPFWEFFMLAMPINMAMFLAADQGRYARDLEMWEAMSPEAQKTVKKPVPLSPLDATYLACLYALKYSCKIEVLSFSEATLTAIQVRFAVNSVICVAREVHVALASWCEWLCLVIVT